eukprot:m.32683 g.32683  ORF g.32683 m.32683 type:complete len:368 (-) comp5562_c0_seq1:146-1249(-)
MAAAEESQFVIEDAAAADALLSLFMAAATSYRCESVLHPFPKMYSSGPHKDFDALRRDAAEFPPVANLTHQAYVALAPRQRELLDAILNPRGYRVVSRSVTLFDTIVAASGGVAKVAASTAPTTRPTHIFELLYDDDGDSDSTNGADNNENETDEHVDERADADTANSNDKGGAAPSSKFVGLRSQHGSFLAFHGSSFENFYSITRNGFYNHLNKTALFGEGTYFSVDVAVCMGFTRSTKSWDKSALGSQMTAIAVAEIVKHPDIKMPGHTSDSAELSGKVKVPETYVVVRNNEHARVKYLFLYVDEASGSGNSASSPSARQASRIRLWIQNNRFFFSMICYALVLMLVGLIQTRWFKRWLRRITAS